MSGSKSFFKKEQGIIVHNYAVGIENQLIVEIGAEINSHYRNCFSSSNRYLLTNIHFDLDQYEDVCKLTFEDNSVDHIVCISVLQHVFDIQKALSEILRVLKKGGSCIIINGFIFPVCMQEDYYRLTPVFWKEYSKRNDLDILIEPIGNQYLSASNLFMRPFGKIGGPKGLINKLMACLIYLPYFLYKKNDNSPLGVAVVLKKK